MKNLFLAILLPLSASAALKENPPPGEPEIGRCYANGAVFFHHVVGRIAPGQYEVVSEIGQLGRGLLKSRRPLRPGLASGPMKYVGKTTVQLTNGFDALVREWEECK